MRFLEDAHRRGVLRQSGATYQFRHARVREHLAHAIRRASEIEGSAKSGSEPLQGWRVQLTDTVPQPAAVEARQIAR